MKVKITPEMLEAQRAEKKTVKEVLASNEMMESIFSNLQGEEGPLKAVMSSLMLPEPEFALVSEQILNELEKGLNDPNDKLALVQSLNANGMKAEDLNQVFIQITEAVDKELSDQLSAQKVTFLKRFLGMVTESINATEGIAKRMIPVPIELCHPDAKQPGYAKAGDAGMDVYAVEDITIGPGETVIVPTGIKCALPLGYEFEVRPRSGMSVKTPLRVANAPGTIDSGYRDEIGVIITNTEPKIKDLQFHNDGSIDVRSILYGQSYTITKGMRFAQLVLKEVPTCVFYPVDAVAEIGFDRSGGFGSSGVN